MSRSGDASPDRNLEIMSNLRRYFKNGDFVFVTLVTYQRKNILIDNISLLENSICTIKEKLDFKIQAYVYLPNHMHLLLQINDFELPKAIQRVKMSFGTNYRILNKMDTGRVWQNRYWDHIIRDEKDYNNHVDYIHYNPVKHQLVPNPFDWKYSSIHNYEKYYQKDWGVKEIIFEKEYGE